LDVIGTTERTDHAIIHFRLHTFEAACELSTGESRVN